MYFYTGVGDKRRFVSIHGLASVLGETLSGLILPFHALTGCDSTSSVGKLGKVKPWKLLTSNQLKFQGLSELGTSGDVSEFALQPAEHTVVTSTF